MSECFHPVLNEDVSQEDVTRALVAQYRSETPNKNDAEPKFVCTVASLCKDFHELTSSIFVVI